MRDVEPGPLSREWTEHDASRVELTDQVRAAGVPAGWHLTQIHDDRGPGFDHYDLVHEGTPRLAFAYRFEDDVLALRVFLYTSESEVGGFFPLTFDPDARSFADGDVELGELLEVGTLVGEWLFDHRDELLAD
jgi:hypothetical protein